MIRQWLFDHTRLLVWQVTLTWRFRRLFICSRKGHTGFNDQEETWSDEWCLRCWKSGDYSNMERS